MWWNHGGWGPMYGWWFMPFFGIICMAIFLYFIFRTFGGGSGCSRPQFRDDQNDLNDLKKEIRELREEIKELKGHNDSGEKNS